MRYVYLLLLTLTVTGCTAQRTTHWQEDMDFWLTEVKKQHYVYSKKPLPDSFVMAFNNLKDNIPNYTDSRMLAEMLGLSAMLGDGHTYVLQWPDSGVPTYALPLRFYLFSDGLFVIDAQPGHEQWIGSKIVSINSVSPEELMKRVARLISRDNEQGVKWIGPVMLPLQGVLEACDIPAAPSYTIMFQSTAGRQEATINVIEFHPSRGMMKLVPPKASGVQTPLYLSRLRETYFIKSIGPSLYVQFNQVANDQNESLAGFAKRLDDSIRQQKPAKVIVDVRHNNGGNADLLDPLLKTLDQYKRGGGSICILTGRNTFSAAQIFISRSDKMFQPVFAGEVSSSRPNFVGEENVVILPHSRAECSISNRYHESIPGDTRDAIQPSVKIDLSAADYFAGKDRLLEAMVRE